MIRKASLLPLMGVLALCACSKNTVPTQQSAQRQEANAAFEQAPDLEAQIVGGVMSARGARPYQVALINNKGQQFCGGTLIHPEWVLTAAHCYEEQMTVRVGVNALIDPTQGESIEVAAIHNHPKYVEVTSGYDIALLKLSKPATLNEYTAVAYVPSQGIEKILTAAGKTAIVSGWGHTMEGGYNSIELREAEVPITANPTKCGNNETPLPANMICGHAYEGRDSCQGDSGGPLAQSYNGKFYVLGVVSYGTGCEGDGLYTRVNAYADWIEQVSGVKAVDGTGDTGNGSDTGSGDDTNMDNNYTYAGTVYAGAFAYAPYRGFALGKPKVLEGQLTGPDSADLDLFLEKKQGRFWVTVAKSITSKQSKENIRYEAAAGQYRWKVLARTGTAKAKLVQTPRGANQK